MVARKERVIQQGPSKKRKKVFCTHTSYTQNTILYSVGVCVILAFCADVCDFGILCGCVRLWHFVRICATLAFCVDVCGFGILCGCVW
jgi:hypothetical protein